MTALIEPCEPMARRAGSTAEDASRSWRETTAATPRTTIVYLITGLYIGGAEKLLLEFIRCLDQRRFKPVVCTVVGGELLREFELAGARVHNLAARHKFDLRIVWRLRRVLRCERPEILHTHLLHADWLGRVVGRWCRVPRIVTTCHMVEEARRKWRYRFLDRWTSRWNDALIAVSDAVKRGIVQVEGLDATRIQVIPNAVARRHPDPQERRVKRTLLGVDNAVTLIGVVSRLEEPRKGHRVLLEALARVVPDRPGWHCVCVGDGPGRAALEAHTRALGLSDRVTFVGTQRDVGAWLSAIDVFVLPSLLEGSPLAVIEAMGAGRPIIATAVGGVPELITHRTTGLLIPPGSAGALIAALEELLQDLQLAKQLGEAAEQEFEARFEMHHVVRQTEALYDRLLLRPVPRVKLFEITTSFDAGGVTTYLANLIRRLPRDRFNIHLVSGMERVQESVARQLGVPHHPVALTKTVHPLKDLKALWQLCRLIRRERPSIVQTHMSKSDLIAGLAARLCGVPCVVSTAHGPLRLTQAPSRTQALFDGLERWVYRTLPHRVISVSASTTEELLRKRKVRPDQIVTIRNGIESAISPQAGLRDRVRRQWRLSPDQPVIGMVGRLQAPKTPALLIESVRQLIDRWPTLVCLLIGDGPQRAALEAATRARHLDGSINFLGCRDDVPDLLSACDLFVLATYSEGMPYSVMEAMAAGLPVITARLEGMEELIEHGRTGWLVAPGDVGAYTRAIETLLHDPSRRRAIGDAAREWIRTHATLQHHVERTQAALLAWYARSRRGRGRPQRGPFLLQRVRLYAREEGFVQALKRCAEVVMSPCYRRACLWFLSRPVSDPVVQVTPRVACAVRLATPEDAQALAALGFDSYEEICALLRSPRDACMIAEHDGRVVAFQWIALGPRALWISPIERSMSLAADEAHLVRCRALRAFRGRGIIPALERDVLAWLAGRGVRTVSTDIGHDHQLSLSTFEKLGLRRTLRVAFTRVGWWSKVRCHRPRLHASLPVRVLLVLEHFSQQDPLIACADECGPRDVKVTVAAPPPVSEPAHGSMARRQPTLRLPDSSSFWGVVRMASALRRLRRRRAFDVLHCPVGARLPIVMLAARWAGLKHIVVSVRDLRWADGPFTLRTHLTAWAIQAAMQRAEAVFCYSDVLRKACVARGWVREERAHRLSDDRAPRDDDGPRSSEAARRVLGLRGADPVVATLIPLTYEAAPWRFLTLCRCLRRRLPQCQFVIAGTGSLIRMLTQQRDEAGLADCLQVIHRDGDVRLLLNACDAFVHFSDVPEASLAALEAQACARWVIELESGGRSDVRAGAEEAAPGLEIVARSMAEVLSHPPRAVLLGQAAQAGIRNAFGPRYLAVQFAMQMRALVSADVVTVSQTPWMCRDACPSLSGYSG